MKTKIIGVFTILMAQSLYALSDYRCTDKALCEVQEYTEVSSIDEAFSQGKLEGQIRLAYIDQNNNADGTADTYATAIGGKLKYETAKLHHISLGVSAYVSQKISDLSGDKNKDELNPDFFDANGDSFAYLGEAYIDYAYDNLNLRIGRQTVDTPLNDRDDMRMHPNSFEALMLGYGGIESTVFVAGYINRWAGYDSGDDISKFKEIPGGVDTDGKTKKGVYLVGVMNESIENVEMQAWYYDFDKTAGVAYLDAIYGAEYDSGISAELGAQYGNYTEKSSSAIEGDVYGGSLSMGYDALSLGASFNTVDAPTAKSIILGFGGGPYFTSMEEMTIDGMNDGEAYVFGTELDLGKMLTKGLVFSYAYGKFNGNNDANDPIKVEEHDFILSYDISDNADLEASYAMVDDKINTGTADEGYDRLFIRANYNF